MIIFIPKVFIIYLFNLILFLIKFFFNSYNNFILVFVDNVKLGVLDIPNFSKIFSIDNIDFDFKGNSIISIPIKEKNNILLDFYKNLKFECMWEFIEVIEISGKSIKKMKLMKIVKGYLNFNINYKDYYVHCPLINYPYFNNDDNNANDKIDYSKNKVFFNLIILANGIISSRSYSIYRVKENVITEIEPNKSNKINAIYII
jgi:hypothetical protein